MDPICIEKGALQIKEQIIEELKLQKILDEVQILDSPGLATPKPKDQISWSTRKAATT